MIHFYYRQCHFHIDLDPDGRWLCNLGFTSTNLDSVLRICEQIANGRRSACYPNVPLKEGIEGASESGVLKELA